MKRALLAMVFVVLIGSMAFFLWLASPAGKVMEEAQRALKSADRVHVENKAWLSFTPTESLAEAGYIFFPGARVPAEAYAPMARRLAECGLLVAIVRPLLRISSFDEDLPTQVRKAHPEIRRWLIGGHSLGGSSALSYAVRNPRVIDGVVLLASRPLGRDLSSSQLPVLSIYGTLDGVFDVAEVEASRRRLPGTTEWVAIEGGNHAQFGYYGSQWRDREATVSRSAQQDRVVEASGAFAVRLLGRNPDFCRP